MTGNRKNKASFNGAGQLRKLLSLCLILLMLMSLAPVMAFAQGDTSDIPQETEAPKEPETAQETEAPKEPETAQETEAPKEPEPPRRMRLPRSPISLRSSRSVLMLCRI